MDNIFALTDDDYDYITLALRAYIGHLRRLAKELAVAGLERDARDIEARSDAFEDLLTRLLVARP